MDNVEGPMLTRTATNLLSQTLNWTDNDNNKNNFVIKKKL
jgi:hypothetical protein